MSASSLEIRAAAIDTDAVRRPTWGPRYSMMLIVSSALALWAVSIGIGYGLVELL